MTLLQNKVVPASAATISACRPHNGLHASKQGLCRSDNASDHDELRPSIDGLLLGIERQSPHPIAEVFDVRQTGSVGVRHDDGFGKQFCAEHYIPLLQAPSRALERGNGLQAIDYRLSAASGDHQSLQRVNELGEAA